MMTSPPLVVIAAVEAIARPALSTIGRVFFVELIAALR
jgi:hypothetical protein